MKHFLTLTALIVAFVSIHPYSEKGYAQEQRPLFRLRLPLPSVLAQESFPSPSASPSEVPATSSPSSSPTTTSTPSRLPSSSIMASATILPTRSPSPSSSEVPIGGLASASPTISPTASAAPSATTAVASTTPSPSPSAVAGIVTERIVPPVVEQTETVARNAYRNVLVPALSFVTQTDANEFYQPDVLPTHTVRSLYIISLLLTISGLSLLVGNRPWQYIKKINIINPFAHRI